MPIGQMSITQYDSAAGPWRSEDILQPTWQQIEAAIRRLDRCLFPFVWLYTTPVGEDCSDVPQFEVTGGEGAYVVVLRSDAGEGRERILQTLSAGDEEVDVWISDQGASFAAHDVCTSLDEVLRVSRYFFDHHEAAPQTQWR